MGQGMNDKFQYSPETGEIKTPDGRLVGYRINQAGHIAVWHGGKHVLAHRLAWFLTHGVWPTRPVDHINGNPADNRLVNLRLATTAQNRANSKTNKNNKSGLKGVQFRNGHWRAKITNGGVTRHLGVFETAEQAHSAYVAAASEVHGEFARAA